MDDVIKQRIQDDITNNKVMLYMKGTPEEPQCGFSQQAANVLQSYNIEMKTFNVFDDENIRQGIKEFSDWPTIPQLYVNGEFIGGCDIITELHASGELKGILGA